MRELLSTLAIPAVSGHEDALRAVILEQVRPCVDSVRTDGMGNLIVTKKGAHIPKEKLLLDVPMDENGVMISGFTDDGFLRFQTVGTVDRRTLIGKRVLMGEKAVAGVVGMKPIHLSGRDERKSVPKTDALYIDIGAKDKKEAQSLLELGDIGWFDVKMADFGENCIKGHGLSSKLPCAVAIKLLQSDLPVNLTVVFSAMERVGTRGAYGAAFSEEPDVVICLDGVPSEDIPAAENTVIRLGKGAVLPISDRFARYHRPLFEQLRSVANERELPWQMQPKVSVTGGGRAYQRSRSGVKTAGIAIPARYMGSPVEVVSLADAETAFQLISAFLNADS